jgi:hypothetical protein
MNLTRLDDAFEYRYTINIVVTIRARHVLLPKQLIKYLPNPMRLMSENEWRGLGVRQSPGWFHYMIHSTAL